MTLPSDPYELQRLVERYKMRCEIVDRENDDLRERLKVAQGPDPSFALKIFFALTGAEHILLTELMRRESLSKARACNALYSHRIDDNIPEPKIVDVFICKMRQKLKRHGVEISTEWGAGYYLTPEAKRTVELLTSGLDHGV